MNAGFLEIINHGQEEKIRLLQNKVDLYSANLEQYKQKSYNETQVRVDFVNFLFYLETKKPAVDITSDILPAFQLRRYGWSGNLKISVF